MSIPATQLNGRKKYNAEILIDEKLESNLIAVYENLVIVKVKVDSKSTLVASLYCPGKANIYKTVEII